MSDANTLVRKQDLNYAAQKQKEMFALKTEVPDDYIISGEQTTTSSADGGSNVYTFKKKGGGTSTLTVKNGSRGATGAQGPKGDTGATGATGAQGPKGDTGATGAQGPKGNTGAAGANGTSAVWFSGTAVTGTSTTAVTATVSGSKAGDMYLNTSTYNVYKAVTANSWVYVCNIKGATGATGAKGDTGAQGPKGDTGATTATVFRSSGVSSALVNDLYLNTSTWNIYQCTVSGAASTAKWVYKGNIKGASGATASTGTPTTAGLTRLYTGTGTNTNGTMTQKAITDELGKCLKTDSIEWITEAEIDAMYASV